MYDKTTEYITADSYLQFAGIELALELKNANYDVQANTAIPMFLQRIEDWMYRYMSNHYNTSEWETTWDDDVFSEALHWQVKYVLKNGEDDQLDKTAYRILKQASMANRRSF